MIEQRANAYRTLAKQRFNTQQLFTKTVTYLILLAWTAFVFYAVGWIVQASFSTTREIFTNNLLDSGYHWENYEKALTTHKLGQYFINSCLYVGISLFAIVIVAAPASYVLSRFEFLGRRLVHTLFIAGIGVPGMMLMIPLFTSFVRLDLNGTTQGLIIIYVGASIPFTVFFLTGFFGSLPSELEEAALIDGCTYSGAFWRVMLPLAQPGIITVTIFNFIGLWNDYFWALIFVNTPERRTLQLGLQALVQAMRYTGDWAGLFASVIIVFLPTFIVYIFLSEKIIAGITAGAVKA
jgi:N-acetylglucosamine transport system permease protein